jgi:hypothetical protein
MATEFTANCKGLGRSKRARKNAYPGDGSNKGQALRRYEIVSDTVIKGGEIFVNADQAIIATDYFTVTVVAG